MRKKSIKVLVVDDSRVYRNLISHVLNEDPDIEVVGFANDGYEAIEQAVLLKPTLITIDVHMPRLGGFEATGRIMEEYPVPIVIVTGFLKASEVSMTFEALKSGAVAILRKPEGLGNNNFDDSIREFVQKIKLLSEIKVVRKHKRSNQADLTLQTKRFPDPSLPKSNGIPKVVLIGASAGGPPVVNEILSKLINPFPVPVILVQHVDPGFAEGLCQWLRNSTGREVVMAMNGQKLQANTIYLAPGDHQIGFLSTEMLSITKDPPRNGHRPSVSFLFYSGWKYYGSSSIAILLSGMGTDGAEELKELRTAGAITLAQEESSCLVFGMPGEAIRIGAVMHVLSPSGISSLLNKIFSGD